VKPAQDSAVEEDAALEVVTEEPLAEEIVPTEELVVEEPEVIAVHPEADVVEPEAHDEPVVVTAVMGPLLFVPSPLSIGVLGFPVDEAGNPLLKPEPVADPEHVAVTGGAVDPKGILIGRTVKTVAVESPVEESSTATPPAKSQLLQRTVKTRPSVQ
jgi:hypothetical protein